MPEEKNSPGKLRSNITQRSAGQDMARAVNELASDERDHLESELAINWFWIEVASHALSELGYDFQQVRDKLVARSIRKEGVANVKFNPTIKLKVDPESLKGFNDSMSKLAASLGVPKSTSSLSNFSSQAAAASAGMAAGVASAHTRINMPENAQAEAISCVAQAEEIIRVADRVATNCNSDEGIEMANSVKDKVIGIAATIGTKGVASDRQIDALNNMERGIRSWDH